MRSEMAESSEWQDLGKRDSCDVKAASSNLLVTLVDTSQMKILQTLEGP